jgi:PAS domain-containing protein
MEHGTGGRPREQPLELILARNLISIISLAAILVDAEGDIVFYNDPAAELIGSPFEEIGTLTRQEWGERFGPFDERGAPLPAEDLPSGVALREGHPAYGRFHVRADSGMLEVEAGAVPLVGPSGYRGAMVVFWTPGEGN